MTERYFPYESWVEDALRGVLHRALNQVVQGGLPGEHHFYVNFKTGHEGVEMPPFLRAQYPDEITIVLQHQFEDLEVNDDGFGVTLYFSGRRQRVYVPYEAVTSFADPSVNFGLQVGVLTPSLAGGDMTGAKPEHAATQDPRRGEAAGALAGGEEATGTDDRNAPDPADNADNGDGAEVIPLDTFRKKS